MQTFTLDVNGAARTVTVESGPPLLYVLRNDFELIGPRFGCGLSQCGACTVHVDNRAVRSCVLPVDAAAGKKVVTLEGLGTGDKLHPLQQKFLEMAALQCGICTSGMLVASDALLKKNPEPSEEEVRFWLAGNLCRCTGYDKIVRAVMETAAEMRAQ